MGATNCTLLPDPKPHARAEAVVGVGCVNRFSLYETVGSGMGLRQPPDENEKCTKV